MKRTYKADILNGGLPELIDELKAYKNETFKQKMEEFVDKLGEEGGALVQKYILLYDAVDTFDLFNSVSLKKDYTEGEYIFYVIVTNDHVGFVEFGTGSVGLNNPYPYTLPEGVEWKYNIGSSIRTLKDGRTGWYYPARDGNIYFTEGMASRPFMHSAFDELVTTVERTAKEVFSI